MPVCFDAKPISDRDPCFGVSAISSAFVCLSSHRVFRADATRKRTNNHRPVVLPVPVVLLVLPPFYYHYYYRTNSAAVVAATAHRREIDRSFQEPSRNFSEIPSILREERIVSNPYYYHPH